MNILYIEPFFGASGDMLLSAFISLGLPEDVLHVELNKVSPVDFKILTKDVMHNGVVAKNIEFIFKKQKKNRTFRDIKKLINNSSLTSFVIDNALKVFEKLAMIEGKIHGKNPYDIHFHEIGSLDSIFDIVGFYIALEYFHIQKLFYPPIPLGSGFFNAEHGMMPVPAFATLELLKDSCVYGIDVNGENITPTAAALITSSGIFSHSFPKMKIKSIGYGVGNKIFDNHPNLVRITLGESDDKILDETVIVIEFEVDDMTSEFAGFFSEQALNLGVLDCFITPIQMKKNRPGMLFTLIVGENLFMHIRDIIFKETTTLGFRYRKESRFVLFRKESLKETKYGKIRIKESYFGDKVYRKPEFDDVVKLAKKFKIPVKELYKIILKELDE